VAFQPLLRLNKMHQALLGHLRFLMQQVSAHFALVESKPHSPKKLKLIYSVSKPYFVVGRQH
jgi:hypothetical protein